ncbi:MAG: acyl-CoA dehydrogenase family protein [Pseudomonadota bacterium]|nr:acyl-CoA dehydrogenase family protein [Pseudomonadota bacterium]MED6311765.1 acyl-CoA dehydrogenase family protein [Pseudomonadota bacterium]
MALHFEPGELPPEAEAFRHEVREFLAEAMETVSVDQRARNWTAWNPEFSKKLGAKGWIGITWPKEYGGSERSFLERYVLLEELLAAGAPVGFHWIADRQSGPLILRFGTEEQRQKILPGITRGEIGFGIGMSEPNSGSDLASVRTKATKVDGGYLINGSKIWTSGAHIANYLVALFRTSSSADDRHEGLTQFIVDMKNTDGIDVRPIHNMTGDHDFNQVFFEDAFIPESMRVGEEGDGWMQVTTELAFERSGPERYLSSFPLVKEMVREAGQDPSERQAIGVGRMVARASTFREMSLSVSGMLEAGKNPNLEAAVMKELGVGWEQKIPSMAHDLFGTSPRLGGASDYETTQAYITQANVSFSLRGGTREIVRGIIARGLGMR